MRKILSLLLCIIIHDVSCSEQYNKATFQKIDDGYVVMFHNKDGEIKKIIKLKNEILEGEYDKNMQYKELIAPDQPWMGFFFKSNRWRHALYTKNSTHGYFATTHNIYLFQDDKTGFKNKNNIAKLKELNSHNSPIETISEINIKDEPYLLSSSLYPSIKIYDVKHEREVKCKGNQRYLLGADNNFILYASVEKELDLIDRWRNRGSIKSCLVCVKEITNTFDFEEYLKDQVVEHSEDSNAKKYLMLDIGPGSTPLVAFSQENKIEELHEIVNRTCTVIYVPSTEFLFIIGLHDKKYLKYKLMSKIKYSSVTLKMDIDLSTMLVCLLSEDGLTMTKVTINGNEKVEENLDLDSKMIGVSFYNGNLNTEKDTLLFATENGYVKKIRIQALEEIKRKEEKRKSSKTQISLLGYDEDTSDDE